jgi:hypothetical protein
VVAAVLFALFTLMPFVVQRMALGSAFRGIEPVVADDEQLYLSRVQEVLDGHPGIGNPFLDDKSRPSLVTPVPEWLIAQFVRLTGLAVPQARIVLGAAFGVAGFLLLYRLAVQVSRSRLFGLLAAVTIFFADSPLRLIRPVHHQFSVLFLLLAMTAGWRLAGRSPTGRGGIPAALAFGALFYIYPFHASWMAALLALAALGCWWSHPAHGRVFVRVLVAGCLAGAGWLFMALAATRIPQYAESLTRGGMFATRFPSGIRIIAISATVLVLVAAMIRARWLVWEPRSAFLAAGAVASVLATNQHILTGRNFEFASHYYLQTVVIGLLAAGYVWRHLPARARRLVIAPLAVAVVVAAAKGTPTASQASLDLDRSLTAYRQDYAPLFDWLRVHAARDQVVFANDDLSRMIPVYTSLNVFFPPAISFALVSDAELHERFVASRYFDRLDRQLVLQDEGELWQVRHLNPLLHARQQNRARRLLGLPAVPEIGVPEDEIEQVLELGAAIRRRPFEQALDPHQADYFIWDRLREPDWKLDEQPFLTEAFRHAQFVIYRRKATALRNS